MNKKIEAEKMKREKLEIERQNRADVINKKYKELKELISEYRKDYNASLIPLQELMSLWF